MVKTKPGIAFSRYPKKDRFYLKDKKGLVDLARIMLTVLENYNDEEIDYLEFTVAYKEEVEHE